MRQFQVVIHKLQNRSQEDEDSLTDLLNERARAGWDFHSLSPLADSRTAVVFFRDA